MTKAVLVLLLITTAAFAGSATVTTSAVSRTAVRDALARARASNLASFRAYQEQGSFPSNTYELRPLNVWRDQAGHLCAAATIIKRSGAKALVDKIAREVNFVQLAYATRGPLMDWILTSGFTQSELAAIQQPFRPVVRDEPGPEKQVVDATLRAAEDARLRALYSAIDQRLVADERASLERATDRLMQHPQLAAAFVASPVRH